MTNRISKVNELIKNEVAKSLLSELRLESGFITVSIVDTTADLRNATIWCLVVGIDEKKALEELQSVEREVQRTINSKLSLKHVPKIEFLIDHSGTYASEINEVFKKVHEDE